MTTEEKRRRIKTDDGNYWKLEEQRVDNKRNFTELL